MRKTWSKKDIKQFLEKYPYANEFMDKKTTVIEEDGKLTVAGELFFRTHEKEWIPSLTLLQKQKILPFVKVDKGTPPFIAKGADLMRPGVVKCEKFEKGALVVIIDEVHNFPLATGRTLYDSEELMNQQQGKVVEIIHNLKTE